MRKRILLSLLGFKLDLPYEREAMRAVRAYLHTLILPIFVMFSFFTFVGFVIALAFSLVITTTGFHVLLGTVFLGVSMLASYVWSAHRGWTVAHAGAHHLRTNETLKFHAGLSSYVEHMGLVRGTPVIPVYESNVMHFAEIRGYRASSFIVVESQMLHAHDRLPAIGALAHELGHAIIPFGNFMYALCTLQLTVVDEAVRSLEHYLLTEAALSATFPKQGRGIEVTVRHKSAMYWFRTLWRYSSYRVSVAREDAADALAVLVLGHTYPLIAVLAQIGARELEMRTELPPRLLQTHPRTEARVTALMDIEQSARTTR